MNVIPPLEITDTRLTSSTVVETAPTAYAGGTTYSIGQTVSVAGSAGLITIYESLQNANTGHTPASEPTWWMDIGSTYQVYAGGSIYAEDDYVIDATSHLIYQSLVSSNTGNALTDSTKWLEIGPTNKWAMFDFLRNTATSAPYLKPITVVITPGVRVDSIALLGLTANSISISMTSAGGGGTVYTYTADLNLREIGDWYDYFFATFSTQPSIVLFDLPPFTDAIITVVITATSGNAECGACVIGSYEYIGAIQYEAEADVLNFSSVTRDFAGGTSQMIQRRNVPKTSQTVWTDKSRVNRIRALRTALNAIPAVWSGLDDATEDYFEALLILGFYKRFSINVHAVDTAILTLELEEI